MTCYHNFYSKLYKIFRQQLCIFLEQYKNTFGTGQGRIYRVCLAVMTDPFAPQVLRIKADKISNTVTAGL